ncbi:hypothetical protein JCM33374_g2495 [Metschnikowia sp. JCM 33374]|nr:hypothetical protein JCM33374_g2495 [Metschnikowia sp. JCM 33374]
MAPSASSESSMTSTAVRDVAARKFRLASLDFAIPDSAMFWDFGPRNDLPIRFCAEEKQRNASAEKRPKPQTNLLLTCSYGKDSHYHTCNIAMEDLPVR